MSPAVAALLAAAAPSIGGHPSGAHGEVPAAAPSSRDAHPWHETYAELDLREARGLFEVALRVDALELEQAVGRRTGERLSIDDRDAFEPHLAAYLRATFLVRSEGGSWSEPKWVGYEAELRDAWLYFELPLPPGPGPLWLSNEILFERNAFQSNQLWIRAEDFGALLVCETRAPWAELSGVDLPPPPRPAVGWSVRLPPTPGTDAARGVHRGTVGRPGPL